MSSPLLEQYQAFAVDLDGVVWRGGEIIDGSAEALAAIQQAGKPLLLLTNNGSYLPEVVVSTLDAAGVSLRPEQLLTSTTVARAWLKENGMAGKAIFVMGPDAVASQLEDLVEVTPIQPGNKASVVLAGRDINLTYDRLSIAAGAVAGGAAFVALNNDPIMPVEDGFVPGTGSIVAALQAASGHPPVVLGKPELPMMEAAARILGKENVLMVGDRVESDIAGARAIGWDAALVMSGLSNEQTVLAPAPDHVAPSLASLILPD